MVSTQVIESNIDTVAEQRPTYQTNVVVRRNSGNTTDDVYVFFVNSAAVPTYRKSVDGGANFGGQVTFTGGGRDQIVVWWDQWTPGDTTGNFIHILTGGNIADSMSYYSLDTATDTQGGNLTIDSWSSTATTNGFSLTITKATNGDLFAAGIGSGGPSGIQVSKSTTAGASWVDITGTLPAGLFDSVNDGILLMPLNTDDDIILIGIDDSAAELRYIEYFNDPGTLDWDATSTLIESGPIVNFGRKNNFSVTLDKTTGDLFMCYLDISTSDPKTNLAFRSFSNSTRTWSAKTIINGDYSTIGVTDVHEKHALTLARDQTSGLLILALAMGNVGAFESPYLFYSSDNGLNWSDGVTIPGVTPEPLNYLSLPVVIVNQAGGYTLTWITNADDIIALLNPILIEFFSGVTFDADGTTPLPGVTCILEQIGPRAIAGVSFGKNRPVMGQQISDGSGNFSIGVIPSFIDESETARFQAQFYLQGGTDIDDAMDLSREETED